MRQRHAVLPHEAGGPFNLEQRLSYEKALSHRAPRLEQGVMRPAPPMHGFYGAPQSCESMNAPLSSNCLHHPVHAMSHFHALPPYSPYTDPWVPGLSHASALQWQPLVTPPYETQPPAVWAESVNRSILSVVHEMASHGEYASATSVGSRVSALVGYAIDQWPHASLPALTTLKQIERTVATAAAAFVATHGIACFADFEDAVLDMLESSCIPQLRGPCPLSLAAEVGEQLQIDSDDAEEVQSGGGDETHGFERFGVGPLRRHPAVEHAWGRRVQQAAMRYADAAQHLLDFAMEQPQTRNGSPMVEVSNDQFERCELSPESSQSASKRRP